MDVSRLRPGFGYRRARLALVMLARAGSDPSPCQTAYVRHRLGDLRQDRASPGRCVHACQWRVAREDRDSADKSSYGALDILIDKSQADLRAIVEDAAKTPGQSPGSDAQKIGDFYESFMNEARVEQLGLHTTRSRVGLDRAHRDQGGPGAVLCANVQAELINPLVGYVDGDAQAARSRNPVRDSGRPRTSRPRLLPAERSDAARVP